MTDLNAEDDQGRTSLYIAASRNRTHVLKFLLQQNGVEVNHQTKNHGETALLVAAKYGHTEVVRLLLGDDRIDVNQGLSGTGMSALILSCKMDMFP